MKVASSRIFGICLFVNLLLALSPECNAFLKGDVNDDNKIDLIETINSLKVVSGQIFAYAIQTLNVPGDFATIQEAINAARPGDTILIHGTFNESLTVETDKIILDGVGSAIVDAGMAGSVITVTGAVGVVIQNLTVQNGADGVRAIKQAAVKLDGLIAQNNGRGILISDNSTAALINCTAQDSAGNGIVVRRASNATFEGNIISRRNAGNGIKIERSSSGEFYDGANISATANPGGPGISIIGSSDLYASTTTIDASSNTYQGIFVDNSSANFSNSTISTKDNQSWGIQLGNSLMKVNNGSVSSSGNHEDGMGIFEGSSFLVLGNASVLVKENVRGGINIYTRSSISNLSDGTITIINNPSSGLGMTDGSSARLINGKTTIKGNTSLDLGVFRGSRVELQGGNDIVNIANDTTAIITYLP